MPQPLYKPLNTEKREIRILVLRPSHRKYSRLKCELIQADLDALQDAPFEYYEAVSYTWGDTNGKKRISLNGHDFWITRNLHSLLQRLRAKRTRGYYWVDAICIDQQNIPERGQQVRLMKAIYESAEQTLVWLGPSNDDSDIAMDLMDEITDADEDANPSDDGEALLHRRVAHLQSSLTDPKDKRKWEALAKLFHRPWWKRVWIRQEVAVASHIMVLCGNDRLHHWTTLVSAVEILDRLGGLFDPFVQSLGEQSSGYHDAIFMDTFRENIKEEGFVDEEILFLHSRICEATDLRDRIFGMVGLADQETREVLIPDYELTERDLFMMTTKYLLTRRDTLDCLSACHWRRREHEFPSWVIDFNVDWPHHPLRSKERTTDLYRAAGTVSLDIRFQDEALCVKGLMISSIAESSLCYMEEIDDAFRKLETTMSRLELLEMWLKHTQASSGKASIQKLLLPWFRTIVVDQDDGGERASDTYINNIFSIEESQHPLPDINLDLIDEICQQYCDSAPVSSSHVLNRRLFLTRTGLLGLGPRVLAKDDVVCIIYGCGVPLILRPTGNNQFLIVGEAYVHSMMDGEAIRNPHDYTECIFTIV